MPAQLSRSLPGPSITVTPPAPDSEYLHTYQLIATYAVTRNRSPLSRTLRTIANRSDHPPDRLQAHLYRPHRIRATVAVQRNGDDNRKSNQ